MSDITILTTAFNRPEFIPLQLQCYQRFLRDTFSLTIINDGECPEQKAAVADVCAALGLSMIHSPPHGRGNPSALAARAMQFIFDNVLPSLNGPVAVIDADLFLIRPFSISEFLGAYQVAAVEQTRGVIRYLWNGLLFCDIDRLPNRRFMNWSCGRVGGEAVDTGGYLHYWLARTRDLRWRRIEHIGPLSCGDTASSYLPQRAQDLYRDEYGFELYADAFLHFARGSGWDKRDHSYFTQKIACLERTIAELLAASKSTESVKISGAVPATHLTLCPRSRGPRPPRRILIGILSALQYGDRRRYCRETWLRDVQCDARLQYVFVLGAAGIVSAPTVIDDLLLLPSSNEYAYLPERVRLFCEWALDLGDWDYLFKCDDDTYVNVAQLARIDTQDADYIGGEWQDGVGYASGGAGYFLSRRAVTIIGADLRTSTGDEDVLVGQTIRAAGLSLTINDRFIAMGSRDVRDMQSSITTHGIGCELFPQIHAETATAWAFRIVMPTCDAYAARLPPVTLQLLARYWPGHPPVDVIHYRVCPEAHRNVRRLYMGDQTRMAWSGALQTYLQTFNHDQLVLLMLDDYGLCADVDVESLMIAQEEMLATPRIGNVHLTWQPAGSKRRMGQLLQLAAWSYSVNTQAALWRRDLLLEVASCHRYCSIEEFELQGSIWFNERRPEDLHCQVDIPDPPNPSDCVDATDKHFWCLPYNNLMRRGVPDGRHTGFLREHGLRIV